MNTNLEKAITGCLIGGAVGDALGLPAEGISKRRQRRVYPDLDHYHFVLGRGMVSDDTEHAFLTGRALAAKSGSDDGFTGHLAWGLRWWLLTLPPGIGLATLKAVFRLLIGFSPHNSGVFSAGNGPAMRAPIIGACYAHNLAKLKDNVLIATRVTHTDPKAYYGAFAVALAASHSARGLTSPEEYLVQLEKELEPKADEFLLMVQRAAQSASNDFSTESFASDIGLEKGVSGYVYHTVPVVLHAWFRHPVSFAEAVIGAIHCGGDTDTVGAIVGGIIGAGVGREGIPTEWIDRLWSWPVTVPRMERLARDVSLALSGVDITPVRLPFELLLLRNFLFTTLVLGHGFKRLLPPY